MGKKISKCFGIVFGVTVFGIILSDFRRVRGCLASSIVDVINLSILFS